MNQSQAQPVVYYTPAEARAAGLSEADIDACWPRAEGQWAATSGPFKDRVYRKNLRGQYVRDRAAERS